MKGLAAATRTWCCFRTPATSNFSLRLPRGACRKVFAVLLRASSVLSLSGSIGGGFLKLRATSPNGRSFISDGKVLLAPHRGRSGSRSQTNRMCRSCRRWDQRLWLDILPDSTCASCLSGIFPRSEEHTSELQSLRHLV